MKVFAEYYELSNNENFRRKTLLQFGDSTNLIGSAVLINPGSAKPIGEADSKIIKEFYFNNMKLETTDLNIWKKFSVDATMLQLEKIFNGWYTGKPRELNGIIQLFNCFYYKSSNLDKAMEKFNSNSDFNFNEHRFFKNKPVYFGWGNTGKNKELKPTSLNIFSNYDLNLTPVYDAIFENNCFYHPGYINRSYKSNLRTIELMKKFESIWTKK